MALFVSLLRVHTLGVSKIASRRIVEGLHAFEIPIIQRGSVLSPPFIETGSRIRRQGNKHVEGNDGSTDHLYIYQVEFTRNPNTEAFEQLEASNWITYSHAHG